MRGGRNKIAFEDTTAAAALPALDTLAPPAPGREGPGDPGARPGARR